jgi:hypothetical protein
MRGMPIVLRLFGLKAAEKDGGTKSGGTKEID